MNLKPYYDAAVASVAEKQRIVNVMDALFTDGKKEEALAMQPELDAAVLQSKADSELYNSMLAASSDSDTPQNFVPAGAGQQGVDDAQKQMTRSAFDALEPQARMEFMKAGGKLSDEVKNG
jgi:dihydroxyacid dehydratase/phosphogluconate dehydratase